MVFIVGATATKAPGAIVAEAQLPIVYSHAYASPNLSGIDILITIITFINQWQNPQYISCGCCISVLD